MPMFRKNLDASRERFGFSQAVLTSFRFLITEFGFKCVKQETTLVRYESSGVFVNVFHGRSSYELGVEIGQLRKNLDIPEFGFTLGEIISLSDAKFGAMYRPYQITKPELITKYVEQIAELAKKYATSALVNDKGFFEQLSSLQLQKSDEYLKDMKLNQIRSEVEVAWREKNYKQVVELYGSVESDLTLSERKKLEYARRKLIEPAS
jgi:hypothetical protein